MRLAFRVDGSIVAGWFSPARLTGAGTFLSIA
jgi:hypothetical protein